MGCLCGFWGVAFQPSVDVREHLDGIDGSAMDGSSGQGMFVPVFELFECLSIFFRDSFLSDGSVSEGHAIGAMPEEFHDGDETHPGVEQRGGVGVSEPVGGNFAVGIESFADIEESSAIVIVSGFTISVIFDEPPFERAGIGLLEFQYEGEGVVIERDEAFVIELTQGDLEEVMSVVVAVQAFNRQSSELADADAGLSHQE